MGCSMLDAYQDHAHAGQQVSATFAAGQCGIGFAGRERAFEL